MGFSGFNGGELAQVTKISIVVPANDMQKVEDVHLILMHMIMQILYRKLAVCDATHDYLFDLAWNYSVK